MRSLSGVMILPRALYLGIGGEAEHDIQREPHRISFDLNVASCMMLKRLTNLARQIGSSFSAKMPRFARAASRSASQLVPEHLAAARRLDGIEITDDVGYR